MPQIANFVKKTPFMSGYRDDKKSIVLLSGMERRANII